MSTPLLSAAMIVRDEESHLPMCLESIRDVVDEIVIVDTGSADATVSIARSFGARVHFHRWRDDFAAARNVALDAARGEWILYIDADERLRPVSRDRVGSILRAATDRVSLRVRLLPFVGATPYWEYRLWRSDPRIRFVGRMHEKMTPAIAAVADADGLTVGESELCLEHVGYEGDQIHKHRRNLPLLEAQLAAEPDNSHNWAHLARVLDGLGRPDEAERALERALETAREVGLSVDVGAFLQLIQRRRAQQRPVADLIDEAQAWYPDNVGLAWERATSEIEAQRYEEALRWLERFDADPEMPVEDTIGYPAELFGARSAEARGLCHFKLGRYREAAAAYRQAEQLEPDVEPHRLKRALAEHRAQRHERSNARSEPAGVERVRWSVRRVLAGLVVDVGGVPVKLSTSDATRAWAMRAVLGRMPSSAREPAAHLHFGAHRVPVPKRPPDEEEGDVRLWYDEEVLSVSCRGEVTARVVPGRAEIGGFSRYLGVVFNHAAPLMLASLLAPHGRYLLHGGAIHRDGQAILILGDSGVGKSTLILGALRQGWSVLSDDLVLVRGGVEGPVVTGIPKALVAPTEVIDAETASSSVANDLRSRSHVQFEGWDQAWRPIGTIVAVEHGTGETTDIEPLEKQLLVGSLIRAMLCRQRRHRPAYVRLALTLCGLPAYRLLHARAPENRARQAIDALGARLETAN